MAMIFPQKIIVVITSLSVQKAKFGLVFKGLTFLITKINRTQCIACQCLMLSSWTMALCEHIS